MMATDSFTASNGTELTGYSANWSLGNALSSDFVIDTNAVRTPLNRNIVLFVFWNSGSFANDQYAEGRIAQVGAAGTWMGLCVRASAGYGYTLGIEPGGQWAILKTLNYSLPSVLVSGTTTLSTNDIIRLEASGTTLTAKRNGSVLGAVTDSGISSGAPGVYGQGEATSGAYTLLDDWVGDDLSAAALQFYQYDWPHQLHARR